MVHGRSNAGPDMTAKLLDGRAIAAEVWAEVRAEAARFQERAGVPPRLAVVQVGEDPAASAYVRSIQRAFRTRGLEVDLHSLPEAVSQADLELGLRRLAAQPGVHGVLVQMPLPRHLSADGAILAVGPDRDVEGLHPLHVGALASGRPRRIPSTPLAGIEILRRSGIEVAGRVAVVVGRSPIVGRPMAALLLRADATLVVCHTKTPDLAAFTRQADLLFAAAGRPGLVRGEMLKPGAVVIDFGINEVDGKLVGDVDAESAVEVASALTPVPGGTGPVTTAVLARNLVEAAWEAVGNRS